MMHKLLRLIPLAVVLMGCATQGVTDKNAVEKQRLETKAAEQKLVQEQEWHEAELDRFNKLTGAFAIASPLIGTGVGVAVLITLTLSGYYASQIVRKKASLVYPNANGQFPLILTRGMGYEVIRDPNRQLESSNVLQLPTPTQKILALKSGEKVNAVATQTDGVLQLKVTTAAQYHQMMQALNEDPGTKRLLKRGLIKASAEESVEEAPPPMAITTEFRPARNYQIINKNGIKPL